MHPSHVAAALERAGVVDLASLGGHPHRTAARRGLVLVQSAAAVAATQPLGPPQHMHAAVLSAKVPVAFLAGAALWLHEQGPPPELIELGADLTQGLTMRPPVIARRVSAATMAGVVHRRDLPAVALEVAVVQRAAQLRPAEVLALVSQVLRDRVTTPDRLRGACRRGFDGSSAVRRALIEVCGGDLELKTRRLRRALIAAGVSGLRTEVRLTSSGGATAYLDLLHEPSRQAFELDGRYHDLAEQRRIDRHRDRWVRDEHGIEIIRIADEEVRRDLPGLVVELVPRLKLLRTDPSAHR